MPFFFSDLGPSRSRIDLLMYRRFNIPIARTGMLALVASVCAMAARPMLDSYISEENLHGKSDRPQIPRTGEYDLNFDENGNFREGRTNGKQLPISNLFDSNLTPKDMALSDAYPIYKLYCASNEVRTFLAEHTNDELPWQAYQDVIEVLVGSSNMVDGLRQYTRYLHLASPLLLHPAPPPPRLSLSTLQHPPSPIASGMQQVSERQEACAGRGHGVYPLREGTVYSVSAVNPQCVHSTTFTNVPPA
jgi:hypothetical protein